MHTYISFCIKTKRSSRPEKQETLVSLILNKDSSYHQFIILTPAQVAAINLTQCLSWKDSTYVAIANTSWAPYIEAKESMHHKGI